MRVTSNLEKFGCGLLVLAASYMKSARNYLYTPILLARLDMYICLAFVLVSNMRAIIFYSI